MAFVNLSFPGFATRRKAQAEVKRLAALAEEKRQLTEGLKSRIKKVLEERKRIEKRLATEGAAEEFRAKQEKRLAAKEHFRLLNEAWTRKRLAAVAEEQAEGAKHAARTPGNAQDAEDSLQKRIDEISATHTLDPSWIRGDTDMNSQIATFFQEMLRTISANHNDPTEQLRLYGMSLSELERRIVPESIDSIIAFITDPTNVRTDHTVDIASNAYGLDPNPISGGSKSTRALRVGTLNVFQFRLVPTQERLQALVALLKEQNIDVLGVTEATTNYPGKSTPDINSLAKAMDMDIVVQEDTGVPYMSNVLLVRNDPH